MRCNTAHARARIERLESRLLLHGGGRHVHEFVTQTNLVSDGTISAPVTDPNLVNPWGISFTSGSPFWIADNGKGVSTLHDSAGDAFSRIVTIPGGAGASTSAPTGIVFNGTNGFVFGQGSSALPGRFLFVTENGTISGWNKFVDPTNALLAVDNSANGAVYKGAALADVGGGTLELFVANFHNASVDIFDDAFTSVQIAGGFHDPKIPKGYAPFNIQNLDNKLYITYAKQDAAKHDEIAAAGAGYVDVFDTTGHLLQRFQHGKFLDAPWGVAQAPASWGQFAGDILIGQFGTGRVDMFSAKTGHFINYLPMNAASKPLIIPGLRALTPGDGVSAGDTGTIYFTAGPNNQSDGLFGSLSLTITTGKGRRKVAGPR